MIDTYYRIKSLHELGIKIHLHCFCYGRPYSKELESICATINYYPRRKVFFSHFSKLPDIISSRKSNLLLENLKRDDHPILFDGLHTTYFLNHKDLIVRRKLLRTHNIEHNYYRTLGLNESNLLKKLYFFIESVKLKIYEDHLFSANYILSISENDNNYFKRNYHPSEVLPPSHPFTFCETKPGLGEYILFHGDLSIKENVMIADSLISYVFSKIDYNCIIAGKNPPDHLKNRAYHFTNIKIIKNPDIMEMTRLITDAQINVIPALASNGFKIKLLYSLFAGRHCLVNTKMIAGTHTYEICQIADSNKEIIEMIQTLMKQELNEVMITERKKVLDQYYNNKSNALKLVDMIFPG
jgi:hypothetical protein